MQVQRNGVSWTAAGGLGDRVECSSEDHGWHHSLHTRPAQDPDRAAQARSTQVNFCRDLNTGVGPQYAHCTTEFELECTFLWSDSCDNLKSPPSVNAWMAVVLN